MKNIYKIILSLASILAPALSMVAQTPTQTVADDYTNLNGYVYSKQAQGPNDKGEYFIFLKSYVTGTVTTQQMVIPSDIVLVLDVSGSMNEPLGSSSTRNWSYNDIKNSDTKWYYRTTDGDGYNNWNYYLVEAVTGTSYGYTWYELQYNGNRIGQRRYNAAQGVGNNTFYPESRMIALQNAVSTFVDKIRENATENNVDSRIALVKFASGEDNNDHSPNQSTPETVTQINPITNRTAWRANNGTGNNYTQIVSDFVDVRTQGGTITGYVNQFVPEGATSAEYGMKRAKWLLQVWMAQNPARISNKLVVLFTDGDPTHSNNFEKAVAESAIEEAHAIKIMDAYTTEDGQTAKAKVYAVGTLVNPSTNTTTYMQRVSSNYPDATGMDEGEAGTGSDAGGFYFNVSNAKDLEKVFGSISQDATAATIDLGSASTVVDVVAKSFVLPEGTNASDVELYTAKYLGQNPNNNSQPLFEAQSLWENITNAQGITLTPVPATGSVSVSGFNFTENACGVSETGTPHGKELIIVIPIKMGPDAVGGLGVKTNEKGSGLHYTKDGQEYVIEFEESPAINLPFNIHIRKEGLNVGESAKFTIQRKSRSNTSEDWTDYTTVFVTRKSTDAISGDTAPVVKIVGLHPDYVYRIVEEGWSWSYSIDRVHGILYNPQDGSETTIDMSNGSPDNDYEGNTVLSDAININPFIFVNSKKAVEATVHHAESKVTNDFKKASGSTATNGESIWSKEQPE